MTETSITIMHYTVDGRLANPFVAVAMGILCALSFAVAYRVARGFYTSGVLVPGGLLLVAFPAVWVRVLAKILYIAYHLDVTLNVGFVGDPSAWLAQCAALLGGIVGVARRRDGGRQET